MRVIVLAKAPVAGKVKTRLMPQYNAEQAAALHKQMTEAVITKVCSMFDDVWLAVDNIKHPFFTDLKQRFGFELHHQNHGDLGMRMRHLTAYSFATDDEPIMFLGTDSPHVNISRYQQVKRALTDHDIVLGPVDDGGYDLIAMHTYFPEVFDNITWGTDSVFSETIININNLDLIVKVLDTSFDLDHAEDLQRAPPHTW
ncbi:TIGR04282 family arsenosugar biosynthesis glycosyltransferase [Ghiorsea bivora]|uniref:TIGR04282 family arsenosugar biosynthesis glycosyltransferase n=1 Tax=Ghiorsea bivora TaxID=1485545 RepID=UPI00056DEE37|nr:TIGR04282 family arsenosugar biosynthesis glycosyltransferase [Ghiorsea bivora]